MSFYDRKREIEQLIEIQRRSVNNAQMTVISGRRRIGKTQLLLKATEGQPTLYFFVARKAESFLCQDFVQEIKSKLEIPILGEINSFGKLFEFLMELSTMQLEHQIRFIYDVHDGITASLEEYFNSSIQETYEIIPTTVYRLSPQTERLFYMDDYPERFFTWADKFIELTA